jgi:hypothetical protein
MIVDCLGIQGASKGAHCMQRLNVILNMCLFAVMSSLYLGAGTTLARAAGSPEPVMPRCIAMHRETVALVDTELYGPLRSSFFSTAHTPLFSGQKEVLKTSVHSA